jgi:uncharacterized membrane protein
MHRMRIALQLLLGATLIYTGTLHLTTSRIEFQAQVPTWLPLSPDFVVIASGIVEIALGLCLISLKRRREVGIATALFFGLDSDRARAIRLLFQPLLVLWALWSTDFWRSRK